MKIRQYLKKYNLSISFLKINYEKINFNHTKININLLHFQSSTSNI